MKSVEQYEKAMLKLSKEDREKCLECLEIIRHLINICPIAYLAIGYLTAELQDEINDQTK